LHKKENNFSKYIQGDSLKDYYIEYIEYVKKVKKKFKKIYRLIKFKIKTSNNNYFNKILLFLKSKNNRAQKLAMLFIVVIILIINIYPSLAIYNDNFYFHMIGTRVGNKENYQYDLSFLIYLEEANKDNYTYALSDEIPTSGYVYSKYNCQNNSNIVYDENNKEFTLESLKKDTCSVYFNFAEKIDIVTKIMLEDNVNSNKYTMHNYIPSVGYNYSHFTCNNNSVIKYDNELHTIKTSSTSSDYCEVYFNKEKFDINIEVFVENNNEKNTYINTKFIPEGNLYILNSNKSSCYDNDNERINTEINYINGHIEISNNNINYCEVYLDLEDE